jgi:hypothetical protein
MRSPTPGASPRLLSRIAIAALTEATKPRYGVICRDLTTRPLMGRSEQPEIVCEQVRAVRLALPRRRRGAGQRPTGGSALLLSRQAFRAATLAASGYGGMEQPGRASEGGVRLPGLRESGSLRLSRPVSAIAGRSQGSIRTPPSGRLRKRGRRSAEIRLHRHTDGMEHAADLRASRALRV